MIVSAGLFVCQCLRAKPAGFGGRQQQRAIYLYSVQIVQFGLRRALLAEDTDLKVVFSPVGYVCEQTGLLNRLFGGAARRKFEPAGQG